MIADDDERRAIVDLLGLVPHPEGGWYVETWRDGPPEGGRGHGSAIYYLLGADERSHWHRVDAVEVWHHYAGAPLELTTAATGADLPTSYELGPHLDAGQRPQVVVTAHHWQAARSLGAWTLVGCTVSPAFAFAGFELAPPGWTPGAEDPA